MTTRETPSVKGGSMKKLFIAAAVLLSLLTACASKGGRTGTAPAANTFQKIDQETAREMMAKEDGHIIADVRRPDEYAAGHIPGAVNIPNETIGSEKPELLPDLDQIILVHCRSGVRSEQAAKKLAALGYTRVYDFGGILNWTGEIVTEEAKEPETVLLSFDSFQENDPEFSLTIQDPDMVSCVSSPDHRPGAGAAFEFKGLKPGETKVIISARSSAGRSYDAECFIFVDEELNASASEVRYEYLDDAADSIRPVPTLCIEANGRIFYADLCDNSSAEALTEQLSKSPLELELHDYGHFEKVGPLPWELPRNDEQITTVPGDVILYLGKEITVYYDRNTWDFTRLAKINDVTKEELLSVFGEGNVKARFWIEWSE